MKLRSFSLFNLLLGSVFCFTHFFASISVATEKQLPSSFKSNLENYCQKIEDKNKSACANEAGPALLSKLSLVAECEDYYKKNHCDEKAEMLNESDRRQILSCEPEQICQNSAASLNRVECSIEGVKSVVNIGGLESAVAGLAVGAAIGSISAGGLVVSLGFAIVNAGESAKTCQQNFAFKKTLIRLHNAQLLESESRRALDYDGANRELLQMQCSDLQKFLNLRIEVIAQKRFQPDPYSSQKLPQELSVLSRELLDIAKSNACFQAKIVQGEICRAVAALGASFAVGLGASKIVGTVQRAKAVNAAHLVGRGELGSDGSAAKIGNYTDAQKLEKARILKNAGIGKAERRRLFESGKVGDGEWIDEAIELETQIDSAEAPLWKSVHKTSQITELQNLRADFNRIVSIEPKDISVQISILQERMKSIQSASAAKSSSTTQVSIVDPQFANFEIFRGNKEITIQAGAAAPRIISMDEHVIDELTRADKHVAKKLLGSLDMGLKSESLDPAKIKFLNGIPQGEKGRAFEVRIIGGHGHQRLLGCVKHNAFRILKYEPASPSQGVALISRYYDLCR